MSCSMPVSVLHRFILRRLIEEDREKWRYTLRKMSDRVVEVLDI